MDKRLLPILLILSFACKIRALGSGSGIKTDLGESGNTAVIETYDSYIEKSQHCNNQGAQKRVLLTGFGLFSGAPYNISGAVVESMANLEFWPASVSSDTTTETSGSEVRLGKLDSFNVGGKTYQRQVEIDGVEYEVCFLILDVQWDLAAAIILYEANLFKPQVILMSGRGGSQDSAIFEGGAVNHATSSGGYNSDGSPSDDNTPLKDYVLPDRLDNPAADTISMTWNNVALANATSIVAENIDFGFKTKASPHARPENDYICNNVSYVILHALRGYPVELAGERLILSADLPNVKAGFFHYPITAKAEAQEVMGWATLWAKTIRVSTP